MTARSKTETRSEAPPVLPTQPIAGRYQIAARLDSGSEPATYKAMDIEKGRSVVVRLANAEVGDGVVVSERTVLETVRHSGVVSVLEHGVHDGRAFLVREWIEGRALHDLLEPHKTSGHTEDALRAEAGKRLSSPQVHRFLLVLSETLEAVHAAGWGLTALRPSAIVLENDGTPRIAGFAPAIPMNAKQTSAKGYAADHRADLYSLGVMGFRLLVGCAPSEVAPGVGQRLSAQTIHRLAELPDEGQTLAEILTFLLDGSHFESAKAVTAALRSMGTEQAATESDVSAETACLNQVQQLREQKIADIRASLRNAHGSTPVSRNSRRPVGASMAAWGGALANLAQRSAPRFRLSVVTVGVLAAGAFATLGAQGLPDQGGVESEAAVVVNQVPAAPLPATDAVPTVEEAPKVELHPSLEKARQIGVEMLPEALQAYQDAAKGAPEQFLTEDFSVVLDGLAEFDESTKKSEEILLSLGELAVEPLREVFADNDNRRYLRRRAGEVLERLGIEVDLVPLWIATLHSDSCAARKLAAQKLDTFGDRRALRPLKDMANQGASTQRECGVQELLTAHESIQHRL